MNRRHVFAALIVLAAGIIGTAQTVTSDRDWKTQSASLKGTPEAAFIIRVGDIDNLGFGWPEKFDPFCGRMTQTHPYPWNANAADIAGLDRMLVSSKFNPRATGRTCGSDGYASSDSPAPTRPVPYSLPIDSLKGVAITNAYLQLFIDDFQAPVFCSRFQLTLNGTRFVEGERVLNAIEQTGPVGKLVTLKLPEDFHAVLSAGGKLEVSIDDVNGAADGFAIDFVRLLINRNRATACVGDVAGVVRDKETGAPIRGARVSASDVTAVTTDADGAFRLKGVASGFETIAASAAGYNDGSTVADIANGPDNEDITIVLEKGQGAVAFAGKKVTAGQTINLNNILFDQGKADLRPESRVELDRVVAFMKENPNAEIELSGHTSSEGDAPFNRSLSYLRVKACKDYVVAKGIDTGRIAVVGYGPDRPVAPNDTESGRMQNRRVEMRVVKL